MFRQEGITMLNFFKAIKFLISFQAQVTYRFFTSKSQRTGKRFYQDFGIIECQFVSKTEVLRMEAEYKAALAEMQALQWQDQAGTSSTAPRFNLSGKASDKLS